MACNRGKEALVEKFRNSCVMEMQVCCTIYSWSLAIETPLSRTSGYPRSSTPLDLSKDSASHSPQQPIHLVPVAAKINEKGGFFERVILMWLQAVTCITNLITPIIVTTKSGTSSPYRDSFASFRISSVLSYCLFRF